MYTFEAVSKVGKWAVAHVEEALRKSTPWEIHNVEDDRFYRSLDVDLVAITPHRRPLLLEVKGDRYLSGNAFIEQISNTHKLSPGCLTYTAADYVIYYFVRAGYALWIPVPALKRWIGERIEHFPEMYPRTVSTEGYEMFRSKGRLVPIQVLIDEIPGVFQWHYLEELDDKPREAAKRN